MSILDDKNKHRNIRICHILLKNSHIYINLDCRTRSWSRALCRCRFRREDRRCIRNSARLIHRCWRSSVPATSICITAIPPRVLLTPVLFLILLCPPLRVQFQDQTPAKAPAARLSSCRKSLIAIQRCGGRRLLLKVIFEKINKGKWINAADGKAFLLYEFVDEADVVELALSAPGTLSESADSMRYPLAGTNNAASTLKMLQVSHAPTGGLNITDLYLWTDVRAQLPWFEYMLRAGWMPDGQA